MKQDHNHKRIFGLDVLRAMAIVLVVAIHGRYMVADTVWYEFPYFNYIDGVDLFFVLSGFLIGTILLKESSKAQRFDSAQLLHFWKRRWFRTLPNYYLVILLNVFILLLGLTGASVNVFEWKYLFFLQNFTSAIGNFFPESWSLSVEEWFYIVSPIVFMLLLKKLNPKVSFIVTVSVLLLFGLIARYYQANYTGLDGFELYENTKKVVITRIDAIGYGLLAAWLAFYFQSNWFKTRYYTFVIGVFFLCIISNYDFGGSDLYGKNLIYACSPLALMLFLPLAHSIKTAPSIILKPITFLSEVSYSLYLINLMVAVIIAHNFPIQNTTDGTIKYIVYWIVVIVLAWILHKFYEKPMTNLRDRK